MTSESEVNAAATTPDTTNCDHFDYTVSTVLRTVTQEVSSVCVCVISVD